MKPRVEAHRKPPLQEPPRPAAVVDRREPARILRERSGRAIHFRPHPCASDAGAQIAPAVGRAEVERQLRSHRANLAGDPWRRAAYLQVVRPQPHSRRAELEQVHVGSNVKAESTCRDDRFDRNAGKEGGLLWETARGPAQVDHVSRYRARALCRRGDSGKHQDRGNETPHYLPLAFRRSAQYLRIRTDTALRAAADIRPRRRRLPELARAAPSARLAARRPRPNSSGNSARIPASSSRSCSSRAIAPSRASRRNCSVFRFAKSVLLRKSHPNLELG